MPKGFTAKDERQVLAIKKSCLARGGKKKDCDRIAFATVNKQRRKEGRTLSALDAWIHTGGGCFVGPGKKFPCDDDFENEETGEIVNFSTTKERHFDMPDNVVALKTIERLSGVEGKARQVRPPRDLNSLEIFGLEKRFTKQQLTGAMVGSLATYIGAPVIGALLPATTDKLNIAARGFFEDVLPAASVLTFTTAGLSHPNRGAKVAGALAVPTVVALTVFTSPPGGLQAPRLPIVRRLEEKRRAQSK